MVDDLTQDESTGGAGVIGLGLFQGIAGLILLRFQQAVLNAHGFSLASRMVESGSMIPRWPRR